MPDTDEYVHHLHRHLYGVEETWKEISLRSEIIAGLRGNDIEDVVKVKLFC